MSSERTTLNASETTRAAVKAPVAAAANGRSSRWTENE